MPKNQTPKSTTDLCASCSHAFIREGYNGTEDRICTWITPWIRIRGATTNCADYRHKNETDVYELEKIAWIITGNKGHKIGFKPWVDMTPEEREELGVRSK